MYKSPPPLECILCHIPFSEAVGYGEIQRDTAGYRYRYSWIQLDTYGYSWIQ